MATAQDLGETMEIYELKIH